MKILSVLLGLVLIGHTFDFAQSETVLFPVPASTLNKACKRSDGSGGVSLFARDCPQETEETVGFIAHRGNVVCCPLSPVTNQPTPETPVEASKLSKEKPEAVETKIAGLKARKYCGARSSFRSLLLDKVIGGRDSAVAEFPHQVNIDSARVVAMRCEQFSLLDRQPSDGAIWTETLSFSAEAH